jgi:FkbM family methyltransferase
LKFSSPIYRKVLKSIFKEGKFYTIWFGQLKGLKSYYRSDINFKTLMGFWETDSLEALNKIIKQFGFDKRDIIVADVGANMGFYSLYFSKKFSPGTKIYAFEPSVSILDVLKKNITHNGIRNVEIVEAACSDKSGEVEFYIGQNHHESSMLESWSENAEKGTLTKVRSTSIDEYFGRHGVGSFPDLIKMDIEGAGVFALKGCNQCLLAKRPVILMESHTPEEDGAVGKLLASFNYDAFRINNQKWVLHKDRDYKDTEGVWGTMLLIPSEKKEVFKK